MAMVYLSDKVEARLKVLALKEKRPVTNQVEVLLDVYQAKVQNAKG